MWMEATRRLRGWRFRAFAVKIEPILPPVHRPRFLKSLDAFGVRNAESQERKQHGANADVGRRSFTDMPTPRTLHDRSPDVPLRSNLLENRVQIVAQLDECVEGHALVPLRTQPLDHLRKPYSLRVTGGHAGLL